MVWASYSIASVYLPSVQSSRLSQGQLFVASPFRFGSRYAIEFLPFLERRLYWQCVATLIIVSFGIQSKYLFFTKSFPIIAINHTLLYTSRIFGRHFFTSDLNGATLNFEFEPGLLEFFTQRSELKEGLLVTTHFKRGLSYEVLYHSYNETACDLLAGYEEGRLGGVQLHYRHTDFNATVVALLR